MTVIKITYQQVAPNIKVTYDVNEVFVGGQSGSPIYVSVDYSAGVASGNVSSVALSMPTGFAVSGSPITTAGTFAVSMANGYLIPTQAMFDARVPYTGATGDVDLGEHELKAGQIEFDQTPTGAAGVAVTRWNDTTGTIETTLKGGNVVLRHGRDMFERVVNKTGIQLTKAAYQAVRVSNAQGQRLAVQLAQANNDNNSADTIGLVVETIDNNQEGIIYTVGELTNINTTGSLQGETWVDGDVLYLSPTFAGKITNVKPVAPQHLVVIGYVVYAHQNNGKIYVKIMNGWELGELHDVNTAGATNGQVLTYNGSIWVPTTNGSGTVTSVAATAGSGISVIGSPITSSGTLTITNTAPDQVVSLSGTGTTTITGTYPSFTINSDDQYDGTVTSITASAPLTGGTITTSGTIGITQASTSADGYLSSTDFTTFNNKQNAISLTTIGTSGAATLVGATLNIPQYQAAGSYVTTARTLTINDVAYDLSADRAWSIGDYGTW